MRNNTETAQPGPTPIPCRALVSILGWAMELKHTLGATQVQETNNLLFDTFIADPSAYIVEERREALAFHKEITELCNLLEAMTPEEAKNLNQFLLNICEEEMKKNAA